jgi:uroporphyrinogen-III synthase
LKTTFELKTINNNLIFSSQNAVLSLIEQNGGSFKTKPVFCVGIKTGVIRIGFTVDVYLDYASELLK